MSAQRGKPPPDRHPLMTLPAHVAGSVPRRGHAGVPGTGPSGQTCGSCLHMVAVHYARTFHKCGLARGQWTGARGTDIRLRDPACARWAAVEQGAAE